MKKILMAAAAATMLISSPAMAAEVTIVDGQLTGFVGKGEVQSPFGMNNAGIQAIANQVYFVFSDELVQSYDCVWTTGPEHNRTTHTQSNSRSAGLTATIAAGSARPNGNLSQFTGWNISGNVESSGNLRDPDHLCPGIGADKAVENYTEQSEGATLTAYGPGGNPSAVISVTILP